MSIASFCSAALALLIFGVVPIDAPFVRQPYGVRPHSEAALAPVRDDRAQPFDWFRAPRSIIGVFGGPEQALITPAGAVQNDFGTLSLLVGSPAIPMNQRVKTLADGWLPIVRSVFVRNGGRYDVEYFADRVQGVSRAAYGLEYGYARALLHASVDNMIVFARYKVTNTAARSQRFDLTLSLGDGVIPKARDRALTHFTSPSRPTAARFDAARHAWIGGGKLLYTVSAAPGAVVGGTQERLLFRFVLAPGASQSIVAKMPYFVGCACDAGALTRASYDEHRAQTVAFWNALLARGTQIGVNESKVVDTFRASEVLLLIDSLHAVGGRYFTHANFDVYDAFWLRDMAFNMKALLDAGFPSIVRRSMLDQLPYYQYPDGVFLSQTGEYDGNGEALWMMGQYYERTHDVAFARRVFPMIRRSMAWQWRMRVSNWGNSYGLLPYLAMDDDELVRGHIVGYDLFAIAGARGADAIACGLHEALLCATWRSRSDRYATILRRRLQPAYASLGVVPPAEEGMNAPAFSPGGWYGDRYGIDWGNIELVYPSGVFSPDDPMVTRSLQMWRSKTFEGEFTYPRGGVESTLHSYTPLSILETYVRRNDDRNALEDLYSALVHTSATGMTSEGMSAPERWGWDEENRTMPHDEFAAKYVSALRDMMAFELGGDLHLANTLSPAWLAGGQTVSFAGSTQFGRVAFSARIIGEDFVVHVNPPPEGRERRIFVHVPAAYVIADVRGVASYSLDRQHNAVVLEHPGSTPIDVHVGLRPAGAFPALSFARAVSDYEANYRRMWQLPALSLTDLRLSSARLTSGQSLTASATLNNAGGASVSVPPIVLLVDGNAVAGNPLQVRRGIGFTTPPGIVSFIPHREGSVRVALRTILRSPGVHRVSMRLGDGPALPTLAVVVAPRGRGYQR